MKKHNSGFTLVEIAIVMVIIGLLLGGVLKGQELITSAKVKNATAEFRATATHIYGYQDRFRALPGDDSGAPNHLTGGVRASTGGTVGNGLIEGNWNSNTATDESVLFWQHVRLANLASGDSRSPATQGLAIAEWLPRNTFGGRIGVTSTAPITGWGGSFFVCQDNIGRRSAQQIDIAMDDGDPASGSVRLLENNTATGSAITASNLVDGTLYTVCAAF